MNATNMFNGMFGKIAPGMCRLSMNGNVAVKTSNGYKAYNMKTGRLVNQDNFVFDIGEDFFDGGAQYLIDEISEGSIARLFPVHQIHEPQINFTVVFQLS